MEYAPTEAKGFSLYVLGKAADRCAADHHCEPADVLLLALRPHEPGDPDVAELEFQYRITDPDEIGYRERKGWDDQARAIYGIDEDGAVTCYAD